jgi:hypothetical protein
VGLGSPGRIVLEPGVSAAIAVLVGLLLGGAFTLGNLPAGGLAPFLAGLLGGYLGERHQSGGAAVGRWSTGRVLNVPTRRARRPAPSGQGPMPPRAGPA